MELFQVIEDGEGIEGAILRALPARPGQGSPVSGRAPAHPGGYPRASGQGVAHPPQ